MSDNIKITGPQSVANPVGDFSQVSFDLKSFDSFVSGNGVLFEHYIAIPSPIGLKERGDIRKTELLDSLESNGMLYKKKGTFNAVLLGNSHNKSNVDGGYLDNASARITMPRFYNDSDNKTIYLASGDRLYIKDLEIKIANYQKVEYNGKISDFLQFPALEVEFLMDSLGNEYEQKKHFNLDKNGNITWVVGEANPGIDFETGKGRVYSVRYLYTAFFYVVELINEVRIGRVTEGDERVPARMGYQAHICREFLYHNRVKPAVDDNNISKEDNRTLPGPVEVLDENKNKVRVSLRDFE